MNRYPLTALLILMIALSGCGQNDKQVTQPAPAAERITPQQTQTPAEQEIEPENIQQSDTPQPVAIDPNTQGEISICVFMRDNYFDAAILSFNEKFPNVKVAINSFLDESRNDSGQFVVDSYRMLLNTRIMSGDADDIICVSELPFRKYSEMGVFADLAPFLQASPEINADDYYMNVIEAPTDGDGKLFVLPLNFNFDVICFDGDLVAESGGFAFDGLDAVSYKKAADYAKQLVDNSAKTDDVYLTLSNSGNHISRLTSGNYSGLVNMQTRENRFGEADYIDMLNQVKALMNEDYFPNAMSLDFYNTEYWFALNVQQDANAAFEHLTDARQHAFALPACDENGDVRADSLYGFAMNDKSKNKGLAWEFMKHLISEEVQTLPSFVRLGVNKKGFASYIENQYKLSIDNGYVPSFSEDEYLKLLDEWTARVNTYNDFGVIDDMVFEEARSFADGKQTAEETAKRLQTKVNQLLNE